MLEIDFTLLADTLLNRLERVQLALNEEEILDEAAAIILNRIRTRFLAETGPDGEAWIPSQAALDRRRVGGTGTLFDTGRLFHSIQAAALGPNVRAIQTDVPYAPYLHYGTSRLVPRPFMGVSDEDVGLVDQLMLLRINKAMGES